MQAPSSTNPLLGALQPPLHSSKALGWTQIRVEQFRQPPGQETYQNPIDHTLCLSLNARPARLWQVMGDRNYSGLTNRGDMVITPAGLRLFCQWNQEDQYLRIQIASELLQQVAQETLDRDPHSIELVSEFRARNPQIEQIGLMLLAELQQGGPAGRLYVESLANVLAVLLLRNHTATPARLEADAGRLSDRQLLQVIDYIHNHLDQEIKLADLAQLLGMSQFHFSRLFKQSTGTAPHQYVLQQRIERAKQLLNATEWSVMEIALASGFSSHSHLGKWFRHYTGMTPKAYRSR